MFGLQNMIEEMLKQQGISIDEVKASAIQGYNEVMRFVQESQRAQQEITNILKITLDMQRMNSAKLDALLNHAGIKLDAQNSDGQSRIEFTQQ